ncbi:MAG TPA: ActS/PrrB/RegB family redox-sensitive histidine kinase [Amaricoccus sp.]|nr:ActS/PrrB/RegB family redox-sensitive histidine kinase [Amaricoccus sp.]
MSQPDLPFLTSDARSGWVRLRTLIRLRWLAVIGQSAAVLVAWLGLGMRIPELEVAAVIGALAVFNLAAMAIAAGNRQLSGREAVLTLLFDLCQLGALLYLTGGLANPFAILIIAPVTIGASVLSLRATATLAAAAGGIISLLAVRWVPIELASGEALAIPEALAFGTWAALMIGTAFLAVYARRVSGETFDMSQALAATQVALAREQQLAVLGGVVAAAAHELGTPLATIKLAASELVDELADRPHLQEDALLVRAQAERCSRILHAMGPHGREDAIVRFAPFSSVVGEAAEPHAGRGVRLITRVEGAPVEESREVQPELARQPEIIQGLRNLIQNAVDFAASTVWIDLEWNVAELRVEIGDDGPGYPPDLIGRIGEPFLGRRGPAPAERPTDRPAERPGYEGMGLGLFIAKTLLERSGARLDFANGEPDEGAVPPELARATGAIVTVTWPRARVARPALGRPG